MYGIFAGYLEAKDASRQSIVDIDISGRQTAFGCHIAQQASTPTSISVNQLAERLQIVDIVPRFLGPDVCDVIVEGIDGVNVFWLRG
jgi:hypothetical protein